MKIRKVEWFLAYRKKHDKLLFQDNDLTGFVLIKNTARYWCADPFVIKHKDINYVFFEMYDRIKRKGCIGYREIKKNGKFTRMRKIYEDNCHLSYPLIFKENGNCYIIPESSAKKQVYLLKALNFPKKWCKEKIILNDIKLVDSTFLDFKGDKFIFSTPILEDNVSSLSICNITKYGLSEEKLIKPIIKDKSKARMAGNFIYHNSDIIRVSQDCSISYGGGIVFSKIESINEDGIEEKIISSIKGQNLIVNNKKFDGIHTYNYNEDYEFIDVKIEQKFSLVEILGYIINKIVSIFKR